VPRPLELCRHCQTCKANRPRGLCWTCYYAHGVRELYPSTSQFACRGRRDRNGSSPPAPFATDAEPGSPEKVAILEERANMRVQLWHPLDARVELS